MRTCVQISPVDLTGASRIVKICRALTASGLFDRVVFLGASEKAPTQGYERHEAGFEYRLFPRDVPRQAGFLEKAAWTRRFRQSLLEEAPKLKPDVIGCRTLPSLPAALAIKKRTGAKLMYDVHELETETHASRGIRKRLLKAVEARGMPQVDGMIVVGERIADWYRDTYRIARPTVVMSVPDVRWQKPAERSRLLRERFGLPDDALVFIYQGNLALERRVGQFVEVFQRSKPDRHIIFMGGGPALELVQEAASCGRIHHLPPVPPADVLPHTASADVGVLGMAGGCLNHEFSMGNKGFEYLFAGIPQIAADLAEMRDFVVGNDIGWVYGESTDEILALVDSIDPAEVEAKRAAVLHAQSRYSWEREEAKLVEAYRALLSG